MSHHAQIDDPELSDMALDREALTSICCGCYSPGRPEAAAEAPPADVAALVR